MVSLKDALQNYNCYIAVKQYTYKHDYPDRLLYLKLECLELRRLYNDIIMVYTIVHKVTSLNDDVLLSYHNANYNYHVVTRGHTLKLKKTCF